MGFVAFVGALVIGALLFGVDIRLLDTLSCFCTHHEPTIAQAFAERTQELGRQTAEVSCPTVA